MAQEKRTLEGTYSRVDIATAVARWRGEQGWVSANLAIVRNPHGYNVGPKNEQVGDTLDRRGEQGNIIAFWGGSKINMHINPSD
jgi:hypothetical protein